MSCTEENEFVYLISSTILWEKREKLWDINLYSDDIVPAVLQKIGVLKSVESKPTKTNKESDSIHLQDEETLNRETNEFVCRYCSKDGFSSNLELQTHMRTHTGKFHSAEPHMCELCGKGFKQSRNLERHMTVHIVKRPFKCDVCDKQFTRMYSLKTHSRIHTNEMPYKCGVCSKQFKASNNLKRHMRLHTGETPYKCEVCSKQFKQSGDMKIHMRIHRSVTPYECEVCGKEFKHRCNMRRHKKVHKDG